MEGMHSDSCEDLMEPGLSEVIDFIVQRASSMMEPDFFEKSDEDLLLSVCSTPKGGGFSTINERGIGWCCDRDRLNERLQSFPGAVILRLTDIDLTVVVDLPHGEKIAGHREYSMTKTDFLEAVRVRLK